MLAGWLRRATASAHLHAEWQRDSATSELRIGLPATLLTLVVSSSLFVSLTTDPGLATKAAVLVVSLVTTLLTGLQTYLKNGERARRYQQCWRDYSELGRRIELLQAELCGGMAASELKQRCEDLEERLNKIDEQAEPAPADQPGFLHRHRSPGLRDANVAGRT